MTEAGPSTSRNLFVTSQGESLKFYIRPCSERVKLRPLIEQHGGVLLGIPDPTACRLILNEDQPPKLTKNNIKVQFIYDCIDTNKLLTLEDYRIKTPNEIELEIRNAGDQDLVYSDKTVRTLPFKSYSAKEDRKIINYVIRCQAYADVKGRAFWVNMENDVFQNQRSWQSLKERYLKRIVPRISYYKLPFKYYEKIKKGCNLWTKKDQAQKLHRNKLKEVDEKVVPIEETSNDESENLDDASNLTHPKDVNTQSTSGTVVPGNANSVMFNVSNLSTSQSNDTKVSKHPVILLERLEGLFEGMPVKSTTPNKARLSSQMRSSRSEEADNTNISSAIGETEQTGNASLSSQSQINTPSTRKRKAKNTQSDSDDISKNDQDCDSTNDPHTRRVAQNVAVSSQSSPGFDKTVECRISVVENLADSNSNDEPDLKLSLSSVNSQNSSDGSLENALVKKRRVVPLLTSDEDDSEVIVDSEALSILTRKLSEPVKKDPNFSLEGRESSLDSFDKGLLNTSQEPHDTTRTDLESQETTCAANLLDSFLPLNEDTVPFSALNDTTNDDQSVSPSPKQNGPASFSQENTSIYENANDPNENVDPKVNCNDSLNIATHKNILYMFEQTEKVLCKYKQKACKTRSLLTATNGNEITIKKEDFSIICSNFQEIKCKYNLLVETLFGNL